MASAKYWILKTAKDKRTVELVVHIGVPAADNDAEYSYRNALVESLGGIENISSQVPGVDDTTLKDGSKLEYTEAFRFSSVHLNKMERRNEVRERIVEIVTELGTVDDEVLQPVLDGLIYWQFSETITV